MHGSDDWPRCYYSLSTVLNHNNNNHKQELKRRKRGNAEERGDLKTRTRREFSAVVERSKLSVKRIH
jgi:hypothetical protein